MGKQPGRCKMHIDQTWFCRHELGKKRACILMVDMYLRTSGINRIPTSSMTGLVLDCNYTCPFYERAPGSVVHEVTQGSVESWHCRSSKALTSSRIPVKVRRVISVAENEMYCTIWQNKQRNFMVFSLLKLTPGTWAKFWVCIYKSMLSVEDPLDRANCRIRQRQSVSTVFKSLRTSRVTW